MTETEILNLRPKFKLGNITVIDWFVISKGASFYCIRSGLRHADGITKSPFYYENCIGGKNAKKRAIESFNTFWTNLTKQNNEQNKKDSNT